MSNSSKEMLSGRLWDTAISVPADVYALDIKDTYK